MVNYGVSKACKACKSRHKKCDEVRPICTRCLRARRQCTYELEKETDLVFRHFGKSDDKQPTAIKNINPITSNENLMFPVTFSSLSDSSPPASDTSTGSITDDQYLNEFLHNFCMAPKDQRISRGYLAGLPEVLRSTGPTSDVAKAAKVAALAHAGASRGRPDLLQDAERQYASLLKSFRQAIAMLEASTCSILFLTTVLLGLYELITATSVSPGAQNLHLHGLSAILTAAGSPFDFFGSLRVFSMANALPIRVPVEHRTTLDLLLSPIKHPAVQNLDDTIAKISPVLNTFEQLLTSPKEDTEELLDCLDVLIDLDRELETWRHSQLDEWQPRQKTQKWRQDFCCGGRLRFWPGAVETYYDLYVSSVWNTYRKCHILVLDRQVRCARKLQAKLICTAKTSTQQQEQWQYKVDALACAMVSSIPFHLTRLNEVEFGNDPLDIESKLEEVGRPVGGLLLMHPINVVAKMSIVSSELKEYAREVMSWIAREMGIGEASVLSDTKSTIPFEYSAKGHVLIWAGMLIQAT